MRENPGQDLVEYVNDFNIPGIKIEDSDRTKLIEAIKDQWDYGAIIEQSVIIEDPSIIRDYNLHEEWYDEWLENHENDQEIRYYWNALSSLLKDNLRRKFSNRVVEIIGSIDRSTDAILSSMESPKKASFYKQGDGSRLCPKWKNSKLLCTHFKGYRRRL